MGLSKPSPETQRDRVLTEDEIRVVWTACDAEPGIIADAFRLMPIENPQKAAERLRDCSKVPDLRLHDLRRTAASLMTGMCISRLGRSRRS